MKTVQLKVVGGKPPLLFRPAGGSPESWRISITEDGILCLPHLIIRVSEADGLRVDYNVELCVKYPVLNDIRYNKLSDAEMLERLKQNGGMGADLSPGDPVAKWAADRIVELEALLTQEIILVTTDKENNTTRKTITLPRDPTDLVRELRARISTLEAELATANTYALVTSRAQSECKVLKDNLREACQLLREWKRYNPALEFSPSEDTMFGRYYRFVADRDRFLRETELVIKKPCQHDPKKPDTTVFGNEEHWQCTQCGDYYNAG